MPAVLYEKRDQVAYITLNRPDALNSINDELGHVPSSGVRVRHPVDVV